MTNPEGTQTRYKTLYIQKGKYLSNREGQEKLFIVQSQHERSVPCMATARPRVKMGLAHNGSFFYIQSGFKPSDWQPTFTLPPPVFSSVHSAYYIPLRTGSVMWLQGLIPCFNPGMAGNQLSLSHTHTISHTHCWLLQKPGSHTLTHTV